MVTWCHLAQVSVAKTCADARCYNRNPALELVSGGEEGSKAVEQGRCQSQEKETDGMKRKDVLKSIPAVCAAYDKSLVSAQHRQSGFR